MSKRLLFLSLALAALAACADEPAGPLPTAQRSLSAVTPVQRYLVALKGATVSPAFEARVAALGGTIEEQLNGIGGAIVSGLSEAAVAQLRAQKDVLAVDAEAIMPLHARSSAPVAVDPATIASVAQPSTAILFPLQWNLRAIGAPAAWAAGKTGSAAVKVAILDTGLDPLSPDAAGLIDPASKSFVSADDEWVKALFPGRPLISDLHGHGTNVASQVSSTALAFAGVNSRARLLGVKVCSHALEGCPTGSVLSGLLYAVDQNAAVINMSLGGGLFKYQSGSTVALFNRVFQYAEQHGVTVVVAAGNESLDLDHATNVHYAYCDQTHVICVSATGATSEAPLDDVDQFALYSNFGRSRIDVAAPGGNFALDEDGELASAAWIYSLCSRSSADLIKDEDEKVIGLKPGLCSTGLFVAGQIGTSQAAPHVAGLAALLVAEHGRDPELIRDIIRGTADDLGQAGTDPYFGRGRVNVARALGL